MPSPFRSPKTLPEWIELDYYNRPRWIRRAKLWISVAVLLVGAAAVAALMFFPRQKMLYQAGPLSTAHTMFNHDCGVCHTQPFETATRLWPGNARVHAVTDAACSTCHDGPRHQEQELDPPHCTHCHREHRGRDELAWVVDGHCTGCHANLQRRDGQPSKFAASIHSFTGDHPEFALWRNTQPDPGTVRFNHELHLSNDLLDPNHVPAKLDCVDCHQLDSARRYMQPVNYNSHCKRCHPLEAQVVLNGGDELLRKEALRFAREPIPHGQPPALLDGYMYERLLQFAQKHPQVLAQTPTQPRRPFPGKQPPTAQKSDSARIWAEQQQQYARRQLFDGAAGCRFCHQVGSQRDANDLPEVARANIPTRWFQYGEFDHSKHRLLDCAACHAVKASKSSSDVLMPKIESCRQCHTPAVGARSDCVECHLYHDHKAAIWRGTMTIPESLGR